MPDGASIRAEVSGGAVGVAGAREVRIENLYVGAPTPPPPVVGPIPPCPYPGLAYFGPQDASRFFGREKAIQALVIAVAKRSFTALVGASGSGKSSVVLAGLAPRLDAQGGWRSTYFRIGTEPDKNPFAALARALAPLISPGDAVDRMALAQKLARSLQNGDICLVNVVGQSRAANPGKRILLIADQFEEVFTLVPDEGLRNRFIDALIEAFADPSPGAMPEVCLVLTLRADFYGAALRHRPLADKLQDRVQNLGAMTRDELWEAIVKPAELLQPSVTFEPGLVGTILDDVERRPGSLPLLQFALREMWGRLKTLQMTRADYDAIGGVEGALAKRAQAIFEDATKNETDAASVALFRQLFTRLVTLGEGAEDTRRIVGRDELGPAEWALAQKLADEDNRLVVTAATTPGQETVEVAHEALIRNWPALVEWVNRDRAFILWRNQLRERLGDWRKSPGDDGTLLRGGPLVVAEEWVGRRGDDLNAEEKAFVSKGIEHRDAEKRKADAELLERQVRLKEAAEAQAKIAQAQQERAAAQEKTEQALRDTSRAQLRARLALGAIAVASSILAVIGIGYAISYYQSYARELAERKELQLQAEERRIVSLARDVLLTEGPVPALRIAKKVQDDHLPPGPEAERLVLRCLHQLREKYVLTGHLLPVLGTDFSPSGRVIVTADSNSLFFWNSSDGSKIDSIDFRREKVPFSQIVGVQWSPRGDKIAVASARGQTLLLSACSRNVLKEFITSECDRKGETGSFTIGTPINRAGKAKFSRDGRWLVTGSSQTTPKRWDMDAADEAGARYLEYKVNIPSSNAFAISSDNSVVAAGDESGSILVFDSASGARISTIETNGAANGTVVSLALNPNAPTMLAAAFQDGSLLVWDNWNAPAGPRILQGTSGILYQISFTNSGELLMGTGDDGTTRIWQTANWTDEPWRLRGHSGPVYTAAFSPDGEYLVTGSTDKSAIVWNKRPALHDDPPLGASSANEAANNTVSGCGRGIVLPSDFVPAGCVETPGNHVFFVSPQGRVEEFDHRDITVPVDTYDAYRDADVSIGLRLESDHLVISQKSGRLIRWPYYDDFNQLVKHAEESLPLIEGKPLSLGQATRCSIESQKNC